MRCHTAQKTGEEERGQRDGASGVLCPGPRVPSSAPAPPARTGADLDEAVVLYEDGVASQVPVYDGGAAGVQETAGEGGEGGGVGRRRASGAGVRPAGAHLSADRICVHQRFQAWRRTRSVAGPAGRGGWACGVPRPAPGPPVSTRVPSPKPPNASHRLCPGWHPDPVLSSTPPLPTPHTRAFMALWFFLVFLRNCLRLPEDTYSVMKMTYGADRLSGPTPAGGCPGRPPAGARQPR